MTDLARRHEDALCERCPDPRLANREQLMGQLSLDSAQGGGETLVCRLTPNGRIDVRPGSPEDGPLVPARAAGQIIEAFRAGRGNGVLHLGEATLSSELPPSLSYWRDVGRVFVGRVCGALDPTDPKALIIPDPDADEVAALIQAVPPMQGAELLDAALLEDMWTDMGVALAAEARGFKDGVQGYLSKHSSVWNVVGRVCFHLAENKRDPEYPFAFIATFVHKVSKQAKPQHLLPKQKWIEIKSKCAGQIGSLVELLQGSLSKSVMEIVTRKGEGLFPAPREITLSSSCLDWATMCKHVAATLYGVGARLDHEPELLFTLRGVDPTEMVEAAIDQPAVAGKAGKGRVLKTDELSSAFGVDIDMEGVSANGTSTLASAARKKRRAATARRPAASRTTENRTASKPAAKETGTAKKKSTVKRATPKKAAAKKTTTKKAAANKPAEKKDAASTSTGKKSTARKPRPRKKPAAKKATKKKG